MGLELKSLSQSDLLGAMARQLGIQDAGSSEQGLSITLVAAVLRRIAASNSPCPRDSIVGTATEAFSGLGDPTDIKALARDVLDRLIVIGDLLELGGTSTLPSVAADDWLYCAPPTFIALDASILLLGMGGEDQTTLPTSLRERVQYRREQRLLRGGDIESVRKQLLGVGFYEILPAAWTRLPQAQPAKKFLDAAIRRLQESGGQGELAGLKVIGAANTSNNYASRWTVPDGKSGYFVGRRPQAFGSALWIFVELDGGQPIRFLDLPWRGGKFRGCDHGWRIQSAIDAVSGSPQSYRITYLDGGIARYEFITPLPLWAERQLRIHGEKVAASGSLIAYDLEQQEDYGIDDLLQSYMWFQQFSQGE